MYPSKSPDSNVNLFALMFAIYFSVFEMYSGSALSSRAPKINGQQRGIRRLHSSSLTTTHTIMLGSDAKPGDILNAASYFFNLVTEIASHVGLIAVHITNDEYKSVTL